MEAKIPECFPSPLDTLNFIHKPYWPEAQVLLLNRNCLWQKWVLRISKASLLKSFINIQYFSPVQLLTGHRAFKKQLTSAEKARVSFPVPLAINCKLQCREQYTPPTLTTEIHMQFGKELGQTVSKKSYMNATPFVEILILISDTRGVQVYFGLQLKHRNLFATATSATTTNDPPSQPGYICSMKTLCRVEGIA